jgi:hypothetical protein
VIDCPLSMERDEGVGVPATRAELTVTVAEADDDSVSGVDALSVTRSSKMYVAPTVSVFVGMEHVSVAPAVAAVPLFTTHSFVVA